MEAPRGGGPSAGPRGQQPRSVAGRCVQVPAAVSASPLLTELLTVTGVSAQGVKAPPPSQHWGSNLVIWVHERPCRHQECHQGTCS